MSAVPHFLYAMVESLSKIEVEIALSQAISALGINSNVRANVIGSGDRKFAIIWVSDLDAWEAIVGEKKEIVGVHPIDDIEVAKTLPGYADWFEKYNALDMASWADYDDNVETLCKEFMKQNPLVDVKEFKKPFYKIGGLLNKSKVSNSLKISSPKSIPDWVTGAKVLDFFLEYLSTTELKELEFVESDRYFYFTLPRGSTKLYGVSQVVHHFDLKGPSGDTCTLYMSTELAPRGRDVTRCKAVDLMITAKPALKARTTKVIDKPFVLPTTSTWGKKVKS